MSTNNQTKINRLLQLQPSGVVLLTSWLEAKGYSRELQRKYVKSGWLESLGRGALIRTGQHVTWQGALYSIQNQSPNKIHIGGRSALNLLGMSHYLEIKLEKINLFASRKTSLPSWFVNYDWGVNFNLFKTDFLPAGVGMIDYEIKDYILLISSPARAIMECLYLSPGKFNLLEAYQIMEGLTALSPTEVQLILSKCNSVKVVRLFLYMAEKAGHVWVKKLELSKINTGKGKRSIVKDGIYNRVFQITIPLDLENA